MKKYLVDFFKVLCASFYSCNFYRAIVARDSPYTFGRTLVYPTVINIICLMILCAGYMVYMGNTSAPQPGRHYSQADIGGKNKDEPFIAVMSFLDLLPVITITHGEVSITEPEPYTLYDEISEPGKKTPILIIDTTGTITSLDDNPALILITKDDIITKAKTDAQASTYKVSHIFSHDVVLDHDYYVGKLTMIRQFVLWSIPFIVLPFMVLYTMVIWLFMLLVVAVIGKLCVLMFSIALSFEELMRLAMIASIPSQLFVIINKDGGYFFDIPHNHAVYFLLLGGFFVFAIVANRGKQV